MGWRVGVSMMGITLEGSKGSSSQHPGDSPSGSLLSKLLPRLGGHAGLPALGITAAFMEPHEELIRWRSRDERRQ